MCNTMYTHSPPFSLLASPSVLALAARLSLAATSLAPWHPHSARFGSRELRSFCKTQYAAHFERVGCTGTLPGPSGQLLITLG